jgi:methylglutaconyl-CoA hydratase
MTDSAKNFQTLMLAQDGAIATITLNRPDKRNAISTQMIDDLFAALVEIESCATRVAIITGAGKAFCSGMDLDSLRGLAQQTPAQNLEDSQRMARMFRRIWTFPKPLIAAVNGAAMAGGCGIATLCDFTLAVPEAKFGYTEVRIGFIPAIVSVFLVRQIGEKRARDLLLTGRTFGAEEARQIGLVNQIVEPQKLMETARGLATSILDSSPTSISRTKRLITDTVAAEIDRALEKAVIENAGIRATTDFREGLSSFLEKRPPKWSGQ